MTLFTQSRKYSNIDWMHKLWLQSIPNNGLFTIVFYYIQVMTTFVSVMLLLCRQVWVVFLIILFLSVVKNDITFQEKMGLSLQSCGVMWNFKVWLLLSCIILQIYLIIVELQFSYTWHNNWSFITYSIWTTIISWSRIF